MLSWITFLPLLGGLLVLFIERSREGLIRWVALLVSGLDFILFGWLYFRFDGSRAAMQFVEHQPWIEALGIDYHLGIDGISLLLIGLTTFLTPLCVIGSWTSISKRVKEFNLFLLLLETGMIGVFVSLDLFLFYLFWEAMLIPMYFLIGIWGHERRIYAAVKFFIYTMVGSLLMLVAILALYYFYYQQTGILTFNLLQLYDMRLPESWQIWLALAFLLAFAIKVPIFPLHTWLPDAHVEAPTAGSVILAAVLLKMGTYGFIRLSLPLFPDTLSTVAGPLCVLALIGIIYGAMVAFAQSDLKKLVAYSSVSHLGFVVLGIFMLNKQGLVGALIQMVNHGLSTGALFFMVGMLYDRRHTRLMDEFGGLFKVIPVYGTFFMLFTLASLGLPGLNNFVGEFLVLVGTFRVSKPYAVVAAVGVVLAAVYLLWMYKQVMLGRVTRPENEQIEDLRGHEILVLACLALFIVLIGVYPQLFLAKLEPTVEQLLQQVVGPLEAGL